MSIFDSISSLFHHSANNGKLPAGNGQWSQLANFFPEDSGAGDKFKGQQSGADPASILSALSALGASNQPPPAPPPMQFAPMPQPSAMSTLANAPRFGQQQMMPTPPMWQPYMWGNR